MPAYTLFQYDIDSLFSKFEDPDGRLAFTVKMVEENPNHVIKLTREAPWAQQHPDIMGPSTAFFYFGPRRTPGYLAYGSSPPQSMNNSRRRKRETSTSRYFTAQNNKDYKWRISPARLECVDSRGNMIALWEAGTPADNFQAKMTIKHTALSIVTEILTTLTLNRIAQVMDW